MGPEQGGGPFGLSLIKEGWRAGVEGWHIKPAGSVLPWIPVQSCVGRPSEYRTCFKTKRAFEMASLLGELVSYRDPPVCSGWLACVHFPSLLWPTCVGSEPKSGSQGSAVLTLRRPWLLDRTWVVGRSNIRLRSVAKLPCRNPFVFGGGGGREGCCRKV